MIPRFEKADEVGKYLAQDSLEQLTAAIDTTGFPKDSFPFVIVNTAGMDKTGEAEITIELERKRFAEGIPEQLYQELENLPKRKYHVETKSGATIPAILSEETVQFGYDLPKDRFRVPYMARMIKVTLPLENMPAFSWETFALVEGEAKAEEKETMIHQSGRIIENGPLHLTIEKMVPLQWKIAKTNES